MCVGWVSRPPLAPAARERRGRGLHNPLIGRRLGRCRAAAAFWTYDGQSWNDEGRARGPALVRRDAVRCGDYQELPLQPFVPPLQVRVYAPGAVLDFVIVNVPPELDSAEIV